MGAVFECGGDAFPGGPGGAVGAPAWAGGFLVGEHVRELHHCDALAARFAGTVARHDRSSLSAMDMGWNGSLSTYVCNPHKKDHDMQARLRGGAAVRCVVNMGAAPR